MSRFLALAFLSLAVTANGTPRPLSDIVADAERFSVAVDLPRMESSVEDVEATTATTLARGAAALDQIAAQDPDSVSFDSTFGALDRLHRMFGDASQRLSLVRSTHPDQAVREAAASAVVELGNWWVGIDYHEGLYRILQTYVRQGETLDGQRARFVDEVMRDYRRAGLALPADERVVVEQLRKELNELTNTFEMNIAEAETALVFSADELAGAPDLLLSSPGVRQADGTYRVLANMTWHALAVLENCRVAETRKRVSIARGQLAREKNVALLTNIVALRAELAGRLGYGSWADFRTEIQMSGSARTAEKFERDLVAGLDEKFIAERETLRALKAQETGQPRAQLEPWDVAYYTEQLKHRRYSVDAEALRVYFEYTATLHGMFRTFERIFGLEFTQVEAESAWAPDVTLHLVSDAGTGEPLGLFYMDMFPRAGKYNHFACFPIRTGGPLENGRYALPVVSLVCNFPPPAPDQPSLLKHDDVVTLFHEFGHVLHALLGRAQFTRFSSFGVPQDFVEAPSQMLESWVWDKDVLDTFAADYRDPSRKVPPEAIAALEAARKATAATFYRRQLSFGLVDLTLHMLPPETNAPDVVTLGNRVLAEIAYPPAPDTAFVAYFGHLSGYDSAYYGYMWSLAIAADLASEFRNAPDGFLDASVGRRLREEIYAAAATRDVNDSIERFLRRARSLEPFLDFVGAK